MVARDDFSLIDSLIFRVLSFNSELSQSTPIDDRALVQLSGVDGQFFLFRFEATPPFSGCQTRIRCSLNISNSPKSYTFFLRDNTWSRENSSDELSDNFLSSVFSQVVADTGGSIV